MSLANGEIILLTLLPPPSVQYHIKDYSWRPESEMIPNNDIHDYVSA